MLELQQGLADQKHLLYDACKKKTILKSYKHKYNQFRNSYIENIILLVYKKIFLKYI